MTTSTDPRILFAAERTLLAWQRSSVALMGFGFVIERFSLFLAALRTAGESSSRHGVSLAIGVLLILVGAGVALASALSYRRFAKTLSADAVPPGYRIEFRYIVNLAIGGLGLFLAGYLLSSAR